MLSTVDKEGVNDMTETAQTKCGSGTRQTQVLDAERLGQTQEQSSSKETEIWKREIRDGSGGSHSLHSL